MKKVEKYKSNASLSEEVLEDVTRTFIQAKFDKEQKAVWASKLTQQQQLEQPPTTKIRRLQTRAIAMAASVILVIGMAVVFGLFQGETTADLLAAYTIENPYPNKLIRKSAETTIPEIRLKATEAYNQQAYAVAIEQYQLLEQRQEATLEDLLYLGLSQMYEKQNTAAITTLEQAKARSQTEGRFQQEVNWFLALAYLQNEQEVEAGNLLQQIVATEAWRAVDAAKLLETME